MDLKSSDLTRSQRLVLLAASFQLGLFDQRTVQAWAKSDISESSDDLVMNVVISNEPDLQNSITAWFEREGLLLSKEDSVGLIAKRISELIVSASIDPIAGACQIAKVVYLADPANRSDYDAFLYACDEGTERPNERATFAKGAIEAAMRISNVKGAQDDRLE